jgi:2-polyprenyl-3-methyl-5-hydroxy-6-metoxy-1,4-benzoquinol methylase
MKKFIDEIKKHNIMTEAKVCDVDNGIPYKDKFFDILFAGEIIEHVSDADYFLDECFRLLKNDGSLCYQRQIYCHLGIGLICFSG